MALFKFKNVFRKPSSTKTSPVHRGPKNVPVLNIPPAEPSLAASLELISARSECSPDCSPRQGQSLNIEQAMDQFLMHAVRHVSTKPAVTIKAVLDVLNMPRENRPFQLTVMHALTFLTSALADLPALEVSPHAFPDIPGLPVAAYDIPPSGLSVFILGELGVALKESSLDFAVSLSTIVEGPEHPGEIHDPRVLAALALLLMHERVNTNITVYPQISRNIEPPPTIQAPLAMLSVRQALVARKPVAHPMPQRVTAQTSTTTSLAGLLVHFGTLVACQSTDDIPDSLHQTVASLLGIGAATEHGTVDAALLRAMLCLYVVACSVTCETKESLTVGVHLLEMWLKMGDPPVLLTYAAFIPGIGFKLPPSLVDTRSKLRSTAAARIAKSGSPHHVLAAAPSFTTRNPDVRLALTARIDATLRTSTARWGEGDTVALAALLLDGPVDDALANHQLPLALLLQKEIRVNDPCRVLVASFCLHALGHRKHALDARTASGIIDIAVDCPALPSFTLYHSILHHVTYQFVRAPTSLSMAQLSTHLGTIRPAFLLHFVATAHGPFPSVPSSVLDGLFMEYASHTTTRLVGLLLPIASAAGRLNLIPQWLSSIHDHLFAGPEISATDTVLALDHAATMATVDLDHSGCGNAVLLKAGLALAWSVDSTRTGRHTRVSHIAPFISAATMKGATLPNLLDLATRMPLQAMSMDQATAIVAAVEIMTHPTPTEAPTEAGAAAGERLDTVIRLLELPSATALALSPVITSQLGLVDLEDVQLNELKTKIDIIIGLDRRLTDRTVAALLRGLCFNPTLQKAVIVQCLPHRGRLVQTMLPTTPDLYDKTLLRTHPDLRHTVAVAAVTLMSSADPRLPLGQLVTLAVDDTAYIPASLVATLLNAMPGLPSGERQDVTRLLLRVDTLSVNPAAVTSVAEVTRTLCATIGGPALLGKLLHASSDAVSSTVLTDIATTDLSSVVRMVRTPAGIAAVSDMVLRAVRGTPVGPDALPLLWETVRFVAGVLHVPDVDVIPVNKKAGLVDISTIATLLAALAPVAAALPHTPACVVHGAHRVALHVLVALDPAAPTRPAVTRVAAWFMCVPADHLTSVLADTVPQKVIRSVPMSPLFSPTRARTFRPASAALPVGNARSPAAPRPRPIQTSTAVATAVEAATLTRLPPCTLAAVPAVRLLVSIAARLPDQAIASVLSEVSAADLSAVNAILGEGVTAATVNLNGSLRPGRASLSGQFAAASQACGTAPGIAWKRLVAWFRGKFDVPRLCATPTALEAALPVINGLLRVTDVHSWASTPLLSPTEAQQLITTATQRVSTMLAADIDTTPDSASLRSSAYGVDPLANITRSSMPTMTSAAAVAFSTTLTRLHDINRWAALAPAALFYVTDVPRPTLTGIVDSLPFIVPYKVKDAVLRSGFSAASGPVVKLRVSRKSIVESTRAAFDGLTAVDLQRDWRVEFIGEQAIDVNGCRKELVTLVSRALFADRAIFTEAETGCCFTPTVFPGMARFIGQFLGKAARHGLVPDGGLAAVILKELLGQTPQFFDLRDLDPALYRSQIEFIRSSSVNAIPGLTFTDVDGTELIPGGADVALTDDNKAAYLDLVVEHRLASIAAPLAAFIRGFDSVCPVHALGILSVEELDVFLFGQRSFTSQMMMDSLVVKNGQLSDPTVVAFGQAIATFTAAELAALLHFVTGQRRPPAGGLSGLTPPLTVQLVDTGRIPSASTCFNLLKLPRTGSAETLAAGLRRAVNEGLDAGFAYS